jgi:hypothetical protein
MLSGLCLNIEIWGPGPLFLEAPARSLISLAAIDGPGSPADDLKQWHSL